MKKPTQDEIKDWCMRYISPLLSMADAFMPMEQFAQVLIGTAVPIALHYGVTEDDIRNHVEAAIREHQKRATHVS